MRRCAGATTVSRSSERDEFAAVDAERFSEEFLAVLDGLSLHVLHDTPALAPERAAAVALGIAAGQLAKPGGADR